MALLVEFIRELWKKCGPDFLKWVKRVQKQKEQEVKDENNAKAVKNDIETNEPRDKRIEDVRKLINGE